MFVLLFILLLLILVFGFWNVLTAIIGVPVMIVGLLAFVVGGVALIAKFATWADKKAGIDRKDN